MTVYKKIFKEFLKQNHDKYLRFSKKIWGIKFTLLLHYNTKKNEAFFFLQQSIPWPFYATHSLVFTSLLHILVEHYRKIIAQNLNSKTKIYIMGECASSSFFNILLAEYGHLFPNSRNIHYLVVSPPILWTTPEHFTKIKKAGINFLILRIKTDGVTTKSLDTTFQENLVLLDELYSPPVQNFKVLFVRKCFGNHDGAHHLLALRRFFSAQHA